MTMANAEMTKLRDGQIQDGVQWLAPLLGLSSCLPRPCLHGRHERLHDGRSSWERLEDSVRGCELRDGRSDSLVVQGASRLRSS